MGFLNSGKKYIMVWYLDVDFYCLRSLGLYGYDGKNHIIDKKR